MMMKKERIESAMLTSAAAEFDDAKNPEDAPGATWQEVKKQWRDIKATVEGDFSESLPEADKQRVMAQQRQAAAEVAQYECQTGCPKIEGIYDPTMLH